MLVALAPHIRLSSLVGARGGRILHVGGSGSGAAAQFCLSVALHTLVCMSVTPGCPISPVGGRISWHLTAAHVQLSARGCRILPVGGSGPRAAAQFDNTSMEVKMLKIRIPGSVRVED